MVKREKRTDPRIEVRLAGKGTFNMMGKECQIEVTTRDISAWGAYCFTNTLPHCGDSVKLRLEGSPEDKQAELVFRAVGTILRVDPLPEKRYGFAVKFDEIPVLN